MHLLSAATIEGAHGTIRARPDGTRTWEADLEGEAVARLLHRALAEGSVTFEAAGTVSRLRLQEFHYDAGRRRIVIELAPPPA